MQLKLFVLMFAVRGRTGRTGRTLVRGGPRYYKIKNHKAIFAPESLDVKY